MRRILLEPVRAGRRRFKTGDIFASQEACCGWPLSRSPAEIGSFLGISSRAAGFRRLSSAKHERRADIITHRSFGVLEGLLALGLTAGVGAGAYFFFPDGDKGHTTKNAETRVPSSIPPLFKDAILVNRKGEQVSGNAMSHKLIALYFSAHWCPPCRGFTPRLKEFYSQLGEEGRKDFEIVFVSSDHTGIDAQSYFEQMHGDWLMVPFDSPLHREIQRKYGVWAGKENETMGTYGKINGIPTLVVIEPSGLPLSYDGRDEVNRFGSRALPLWLSSLLERRERKRIEA